MSHKARGWCLARKAQRRLMRYVDEEGRDVFGEWVIPEVMAVDPAVKAFGGNFGFSDGSVLSRWWRVRKLKDGTRRYLPAFSAHNL